MADDAPLYNLKAVIKEVGLSPETIRAWERRYGLLKPKRTPGGHRLFSRRDIEMLKWLVERQKEGLSISRAVEIWNRIKADEHTLPQHEIAPLSVGGMGEPVLNELREQWVAACMAFDDQAANHALDQAFSISAPETICIEVLMKGLAHIGEGWYAGSVKVQQEHFASAIAMRRLNALMAATIPPTRPGHILAACPTGEEHTFILLMVAYLLRRRGWDVVYLGANVPLDDLDATIESLSPLLVISAAQTLAGAASLRKMSEMITSKGASLAYGGWIFTHVFTAVNAISGYYLGDEVASVPHIVEQLLTEHPHMPEASAVAPQYLQTSIKLLENELNISRYVGSWIYAEPFVQAHLEAANANFTRMIASALELGDINYLDQSSAWLNGLLKNHGISLSMMKQFYSTYSLAVAHYLGQDGEMIQNWLRKQLFGASEVVNGPSM